MTDAFRIEIDADGIALLTWDMAGRSMNVMTADVITELAGLVERFAADGTVRGVIVQSAKDNFSGGADLAMIRGLCENYDADFRAGDEAAAMRRLFEDSRRLSVLYRRLETAGKPWVAALNGICFGGAFELALACHHRIAASDTNTRIGLPEVKVGLFPGAGGSQRVPRMIATDEALKLMLRGEPMAADRARQLGLLDDLLPRAEMVEAARKWILDGGSAVKPWDADNYRAPGGAIWSRAGFATWPPANALYRRETYDNYPGARAILKTVFDGLQLPMDRALTVESRHFAHVLRTPESAAMIRSLFVSMQALGKGARRPKSEPDRTPRRIGVIGAGFMGAGIAFVTAQAGISVAMIDRDEEAAARGLETCRGLARKLLERGRLSAEGAEKLIGLLSAGTDYSVLADCDLVIEAVFEDRAVKAEVTAGAAAAMPPGTIFASNTSTLPITTLAETFTDPERFVGVHFFSPVDRMMLVEVIRGGKTGPAALATALDYVKAIRRTPIVVEDSRGFYTSRTVLTYIREGHIMLAEGVPPAMIENCARMAGMPVGPLALNDEIALDLGLKIAEATQRDLGADYVETQSDRVLRAMVLDHGRHGRKNGRGFYDYPKGGQKSLWPGLAEIAAGALDPDTVDVGELKSRLLAIQALEAVRIFEEGTLTDVREADVGAILGFGFAPFTGGPISWIDGMGPHAFVEMCRRLAERHGPRFDPPRLLVEMASAGERFYTRFAPADAA